VGNKSKETLERIERNKPKMTPKQIRARARRLAAKGKPVDKELKHLYKPLDEWDEEELARGRPRDKNGHFSGSPPRWITRELHEQITEKFASIVKTGMNGHTVTALKVLGTLLENDDTDENGRPIIAPGTKADIAKFLIEHVVGKPTQRVEGDLSVKLQGMLGLAMVMPDDPRFGGEDSRALRPGSPGSVGVVDLDSYEVEDDEDE
jgi:hypothetical protein